MKLNHLDLQVADVPAAVAFFVTHFALEPRTRLDSPALAVLTDASGFTLVLQRKEQPVYPEGFHLGFYVDEPAQVHARRDALAAAGVRVSPVESNNRGTACYCRGPSELVIEVSCPKAFAPKP